MVSEKWRQLSLGEVATLQRGYDLPHKERKPGTVPIISSSGSIDTHNESRVAGPGVVTGRYGTIGEVFFVSEDFWPLNTTLFVKDFKGNDPLFISFLLRSIDYHSYSGKSGVPGVNRNDLHEIGVSLPPLPEQHTIATALSDIDALITSLDRLIAKKRDIKQATMQQLLTGKTRLPGFSRDLKSAYKQTEVGMIPSDWEPTPLGLISAFITKGATPTTYGFNWVNDGVLFLRSECVSEQGLDLTQSMFITPEAHNTLKRGEVRAGDILITITGNVGRVIYLSNDFGLANINQHIARIRIIDNNVAADYVFHFLSQSTIRKYYGSIITGQAYPQISLKQVRDTRIPIPPTKAEQQAIATVLSEIDAEIAALEQKRDKTRALKQGMMQELLTGKTRLL
jgi:type I restriction enzyme, S subunit